MFCIYIKNSTFALLCQRKSHFQTMHIALSFFTQAWSTSSTVETFGHGQNGKALA